MRECKDCRWSLPGHKDEFMKCDRPGTEVRFWYCSTERDPRFEDVLDTCGPSGRYFKSRHTLVLRVLRALGVIQ